MAEAADETPLSLCHDDNDELNAELCQGNFPRKSTPGPCARCAQKLKILGQNLGEEATAAKLAKLDATIQCEECSTYSTSLRLKKVGTSEMCGRCIRERGLVDPDVEAVKDKLTKAGREQFKLDDRQGPPPPPPLRPHAWQGRNITPLSNMGPPLPPRPPPPFANIGNSLHTNEGIASARAAAMSHHGTVTIDGDRFLTVSATPQLSGIEKKRFGAATTLAKCERTYPDQSIVQEVFEDLLSILNPSWVLMSATGKHPLTMLETNFHYLIDNGRTHKPVTLPLGSYTMTLAAFLKTISNELNKPIYFPSNDKQKSKPRKLADVEPSRLTFAMNILTDNFFERIEKFKEGNKRLTSSVAESSRRPRKSALPSIIFSAGQMPLNFVAQSLMAPIQFAYADITITLAEHATIDLFTMRIQFPNEPDILDGFIAKDPDGKGICKVVHKLQYNRVYRAAKRFFNIGRGAGDVQPEENKQAIFAEVYNLRIGRELLKRFYAEAEDFNVDVYRLIEFTPVEVIKDLKSGDIWMVEPQRVKTVAKLSGSYEHPEPDADAPPHMHTLYTFVHWVYEQFEGEGVFADVQVSSGPVSGQDGYHVFDPMFHSTEQEKRGVGDGGRRGIKAWKTQHRCTALCVSMGLAAVTNDPESDDDGNEPEEHDNRRQSGHRRTSSTRRSKTKPSSEN